MISFVSKLSNTINSIFEKIIVLLFIILTAVNGAGVFTRYLFDKPIIWAYEVTILLFSWMVFMGISVAYKRSEHIQLDFLIGRLSKKSPKYSIALEVIIAIISIAFLLLGISVTDEIFKATLYAKYNTIPVSTVWLYASFPVGAVASIVHLIDKIIKLTSKNENVQE